MNVGDQVWWRHTANYLRQLDTSPRCACGHRLYDHLSERSRCNEATKRCRCMLFHREEAK